MRIVFMGTPQFAVPTLNKLLNSKNQGIEVVATYTQPDRPVGRGLKLQSSPVKKLALENNIPVFTPERISSPEEVERLIAYQADFFVVVAYGQILKPAVINAAKLGCINIHSSLLPRWRGAAPIQWSLWSGDVETGISTMMIVQKLDAGDILLQNKTKIEGVDTATTLHDRLSLMGAELIVPTLVGVRDRTIKPIKQDESLVTYAYKLEKEMGVLSYQKTAKEMDLSVRALNPWPGTLIQLSSGQKIKVKNGFPKVGMNRTKKGLLYTEAGDLYIQCSVGSYQIVELQEEGKKPMFVADFLNGLKGRGIELPLELKE